jgi:hypothetical protein
VAIIVPGVQSDCWLSSDLIAPLRSRSRLPCHGERSGDAV